MKKGMTLIETVVSVSVFSVFCLSFFYLLRAEIYLLGKTKLKTSQLLEIENKMERIKSAPFSFVSGDAFTSVTDIGPGLKAVEVSMYGINICTLRSAYP